MGKEESYFIKLDKEDIEYNRREFKENLTTPAFFPERTVAMLHGLPDKTFRVTIDEVSISEAILKPTYQNPLFEALHFQSLRKLERYIKRNRIILQRIVKYYSGRKPAQKIDKIELWISKNIPNTPYEAEYYEAFKIVNKHPDPKGCSNSNLANLVLDEFEKNNFDTEISHQTLRKKIGVFKNSLPL